MNLSLSKCSYSLPLKAPSGMSAHHTRKGHAEKVIVKKKSFFIFYKKILFLKHAISKYTGIFPE